MSSKKYFENLQDFINAYNVQAEIIDLKVPMKTSEAAAEVLKTDVGNIFKSVFLSYKKTSSEREYALIVLAGDAKINLEKIAALQNWNMKKISFATGEIATEKTGFQAGGTPPIGHKEQFQVIVDQGLLKYDFGYGGGGKPELLLKISPQEIIKHTNAMVAEVSK